MRRLLLFLVLAGALPAVIAACGSSGTSSGSSATTASNAPARPASTTTAPATLTTARTGLGTVLVDGRKRTLYLFEKDHGPMSTCNGGCAGAWPPALTQGKPTAGGAAASRLLGVTKRSDGGRQLTYAGHPLYEYAGDQGPGQTNGQGIDEFGAEWYVVAPSGKKIDHGS